MTETTTANRTAVLGLGAMGLPMATRLAAVAPGGVVGYDPFEPRRELAACAGVLPAVSAAEAVQGADVAVIAVRSADQIDEVLFGARGAASGLREGAVVVITSTVGAACVVDVAARLAEGGVLTVDAPVSGGAVRAGDGTLLIMIGGSQEALAAGRPTLTALGETLVETGPVGAGQNMKAVNQLLCGIHTAAAAEALAMAASLGLDPRRCVEVFMQGAAASFMLGDRGPRMAEQLRGAPVELRSRLDIIDKDMGIVGDLNRAAHLPTPVAGAAENLYRTAMKAGLAAQDDSALAVFLHGGALSGN
ncbi:MULTISPECIES: NAD(P)-dependent oxidoreductase [Actinomyces]|uniref:3-hydroxyisobutyrate dehydrogenase signature n=1 Tax=Actinomyces glycerinitolerans TaxID=1892869 RepID=A0A1M4RZ51_9ACTO|nr:MULTISPECIES: NAD(P)-dependent oxidoreductase [Actinomyces]RAX18889.1 NAD(P)-dependent oxidoreductase [Actinomyces sp. Z5]RAX24382.1 NAD(P)-dependent oxidoreductase [Actinomyces sp. Z3]SHE25263.1 3-hydroxyisobutyrate dehydrogenase signature [Actinomyces glycerinitolerans]